jgi:hypothetical protein
MRHLREFFMKGEQNEKNAQAPKPAKESPLNTLEAIQSARERLAKHFARRLPIAFLQEERPCGCDLCREEGATPAESKRLDPRERAAEILYNAVLAHELLEGFRMDPVRAADAIELAQGRLLKIQEGSARILQGE